MHIQDVKNLYHIESSVSSQKGCMVNVEKKFSRLVCPIKKTETINIQNSEHQMPDSSHAK